MGSHYGQFETKKFREALSICPSSVVKTFDDRMGFENRNLQDDAVRHTSPRKHTLGKPEGARFCYIGHLAAVSEFNGRAEDYLSNSLDDLINYGTEQDLHSIVSHIINHAGEAMGGQEELWAGVIAVRNHALQSGKYTPESYKEPIDTNLLLDAMARHLIAYLFIGKLDKESGQNHVAHIVANVVMYAAQMEL